MLCPIETFLIGPRIASIFQILLLKLDLGTEALFLQPVSVGLGVGTAEDIIPAILCPLNQ